MSFVARINFEFGFSADKFLKWVSLGSDVPYVRTGTPPNSCLKCNGGWSMHLTEYLKKNLFTLSKNLFEQ